MAGWYGPPIAVGGVPGGVYVGGDGDFCGRLNAGWEASAFDRAAEILRRAKRAYRMTVRGSHSQLNAGFSSLADLVANYRNGEQRIYPFTLSSSVATIASSVEHWVGGNQPAAGSAPPAAPTGRNPGVASGGFVPQNPTETNAQQYLASGQMLVDAAANFLLVDRLFDVTKTMSSTVTEAVDGTLTRYTSTTAGAQDSAEGNFLWIGCRTMLPAGAHNWTVCTYTDQAGNAGATLPSVTGVSACAARRNDMPLSRWFAPLAAGDSGILALTQMQCSASLTGAVDFVINHPIAWFPCPVAAIVCRFEFIRTAFTATRIFDDSCLSFLQVNALSATSANPVGSFNTVCG